MYLDPGFGGMFLQAVVALAAVGGGVMYSFRRKISSLFKKDGGKPKKPAPRAPADGDDAIDVLDEN